MLKKRKLLILLAVLVVVGAVLFHFRDILSLLFTVAAPESSQSVQQEKDFNVLLMGIGGGNHDGPNLTDTIILANIRPSKNQVNLISIPRDLWIPELGNKINDAYASGQDQGKGIAMADAVIQKVTGINPEYTVVIDFNGFIKLVNEIGGIDVNVARTFDDYAYPVRGAANATCGLTDTQIASFSAAIASGSASEEQVFSCRYMHIHFNKGEQHMDGETALEYARSRHAYGIEGTDFARSARQELVIKAIRAKMLSLNILLNPIKLLSIYNILKDNINTNVPVSNYKSFIEVAKRMKSVKIKTFVIGMPDATNEYGLLVNPPPTAKYGYAWLLEPRVGMGDYSEIHSFVNCVTTVGNCQVTSTGVVALPPKISTPSAMTNQAGK